MNSSTLSPVACAPWCEDGSGHIYESMHEDQVCLGTPRIVTVSSDDADTPQELALYEAQAPGEALLVTISHNGGHGPALTLTEARTLRDALDSILSVHAAVKLQAA